VQERQTPQLCIRIYGFKQWRLVVEEAEEEEEREEM
jgi:hypothetical protein